MMTMELAKSISLSILLIFTTFDASCAFRDEPLTLLISFGGFRWDYLSKANTPNFDQLIKDGSFAPDGIVSAFVTDTFPNQHTIATGLWPESHGIVADEMYDPVLDDHFDNGKTGNDSSLWWDTGAEPIWVTNQRRGGKSGVYDWPGADVKIKNTLPNFRNSINSTDTVTFNERVDTVIDWFTSTENPINMGLLYLKEPDHTGHTYGPDAPEMVGVISMCDETIGHLVQRLRETNLYNKTNVIITSDHGMTAVDSTDRLIVLKDILGEITDMLDIIGTSPVVGIRPHDDKFTRIIYTALGSDEHMSVYLKDEIPDELHYKKNPRIMPIILVANEGWTIVFSRDDVKDQKGDDGYSNTLKSMSSFFIAHGPAFKSNFSSLSFNNVDIYALICQIMGLEAAPNNGSLAIVSEMLNITYPTPIKPTTSGGGGGASGGGDGPDDANPSSKHSALSQRLIIAIVIAGIVSLTSAIFLTGMCIRQHKNRMKEYTGVPTARTYEASKLLVEQEDDIA
ncbi:ectonucleotide pyrophosphatase/phosphodiesterase family member 5-like [Saccoglossus kowalevskii]|uniref:Ectonucleotide pyrophosphatase/phosphodiesterase family member 5-like n=1 Tax=Saccoglossus kowalevskii TaxID=10224 RepID=A0ABM0GN82_SACKO|nr:PREDICTED: ectonucleotide pyrophosphatase/phosphodiesterase family member 5-like [Saccoglossus kowalevskii]